MTSSSVNYLTLLLMIVGSLSTNKFFRFLSLATLEDPRAFDYFSKLQSPFWKAIRVTYKPIGIAALIAILIFWKVSYSSIGLSIAVIATLAIERLFGPWRMRILGPVLLCVATCATIFHAAAPLAQLTLLSID